MEQTVTAIEERIRQEANDVVNQAKAITITTNDKYLSATEFLKVIKGMQKKVAETFDPIVKKAYDTWQEASGQRRKYQDPLKDAETRVKNKMAGWISEQEKKRREEEAAAQEKARKDAEALQKKAEKAEENGNEEKAAQLRQAATQKAVSAPVTKTEVPKANGISYREEWHAEVIDKPALIRAIAQGKASDDFVTPNQSSLDGFAKATKGKMPVPGVRFFSKPNVAAGRGEKKQKQGPAPESARGREASEF